MGRPKRSHGEGNIRKRTSGKRTFYEVSLLLGEDTLGKPVRWYGYAPTREEAKDKLQDAIVEHRKGRLAVGPRQTVAEYLQRWLEIVQPNLRPRVHIRYSELINLHVVPYLGNVRLDRLEPDHLERLYALLAKECLEPACNRAKKPLSPQTILHTSIECCTAPWRPPYARMR
ncbi:MAG: N-terminal phage integrase SAM-like domain-containing protein [Chloroflexi bacterium]|nr:N-terminal phage integrase SAM-like domain-containing protein [Chloroflexota bacterium]